MIKLRDVTRRLQGAGLLVPEVLSLGRSGSDEIGFLRVGKAHVLDTWRQIREAFGVTGLWPFVIASADANAILLREERVIAHSPDETLRHAVAFPIESWFAGRRRALVSDFDPQAGAWTAEAKSVPRGPLLPVTEDAKGDTCVALVPVCKPWQTFAFLPIASTPNYCDELDPVVHTAIWKYWDERWGVEPFYGAYNVVELVPRSWPRSREQLLALAWEHYSYCPDVLNEAILSHEDRSTWHLEDLAFWLGETRAWGFWWD